MVTRRRRLTTWNDNLIDIDVASAQQQTATLTAGLVPLDMASWTLTRMIIGLTLIANPPSAVTGAQKISLGIAMQSEAVAGASGPDWPFRLLFS